MSRLQKCSTNFARRIVRDQVNRAEVCAGRERRHDGRVWLDARADRGGLPRCCDHGGHQCLDAVHQDCRQPLIAKVGRASCLLSDLGSTTNCLSFTCQHQLKGPVMRRCRCMTGLFFVTAEISLRSTGGSPKRIDLWLPPRLTMKATRQPVTRQLIHCKAPRSAVCRAFPGFRFQGSRDTESGNT